MRRLLALFLAVACGCRYWIHEEHNAPGRVVVSAPRAPALRSSPGPRRDEPAPPLDPGECARTLTIGPLAGGALRWESGARSLLGFGGLQVGAHWGCSRESHRMDNWDLPFMDLIAPAAMRETIGVNVGWTFLQGGDLPANTGALYVEAEAQILHGFLRFAGGYAWTPRGGDHGPQATFAQGPVFGRVRHLFGAGTEVHFGVDLRWAIIWVRSR